MRGFYIFHMRVPVLKGKQVLLRPLRISDAPAFCAWFKNSEVTRFLLRHENPPPLREYGIFIGNPRYWGQGLGTEAGRLAVGWAFRKLRLHRIELRVFAYNIRGIKSYQKIGFHPEGRLRDYIYRDGVYHDEIMMGILRKEFLVKRS